MIESSASPEETSPSQNFTAAGTKRPRRATVPNVEDSAVEDTNTLYGYLVTRPPPWHLLSPCRSSSNSAQIIQNPPPATRPTIPHRHLLSLRP